MHYLNSNIIYLYMIPFHFIHLSDSSLSSFESLLLSSSTSGCGLKFVLFSGDELLSSSSKSLSLMASCFDSWCSCLSLLFCLDSGPKSTYSLFDSSSWFMSRFVFCALYISFDVSGSWLLLFDDSSFCLDGGGGWCCSCLELALFSASCFAYASSIAFIAGYLFFLRYLFYYSSLIPCTLTSFADTNSDAEGYSWAAARLFYSICWFNALALALYLAKFGSFTSSCHLSSQSSLLLISLSLLELLPPAPPWPFRRPILLCRLRSCYSRSLAAAWMCMALLSWITRHM